MRGDLGPKLLFVDDDWWDFTPQVALLLTRNGSRVDRLRCTLEPSRSCSVFHRDQAVKPDDLADTVAILMAEEDYAWIIPCSDRAATLLRASDSRNKVFGGPASAYIPLLTDKGAMVRAVSEWGVKVPGQLEVGRRQDVVDAAERFGLPLVVKGSGGSNGDQVSFAASVEDAWRMASNFLDRGLAPVLQEYFEGDPVVVGGLFNDGEPIRLHIVRTVRRHPRLVGNSIEVETFNDSEIRDAALTVFRRLRWTGLADVDLLWNGIDDHVFLELNGRPWGSMLVARRAGVEFGRPFVELLDGGTPASDVSFQTGVTSCIFPKQFLAQIQIGTLGELWRILCGVRTWRNAPWESPRLVMDLTRRTMRVWAGSMRTRLPKVIQKRGISNIEGDLTRS